MSVHVDETVAVYFSPTQSTGGIVRTICSAMPWKVREMDLTPFSASALDCDFTSSQLVVVGFRSMAAEFPLLRQSVFRIFRETALPGCCRSCVRKQGL